MWVQMAFVIHASRHTQLDRIRSSPVVLETQNFETYRDRVSAVKMYDV